MLKKQIFIFLSGTVAFFLTFSSVLAQSSESRIEIFFTRPITPRYTIPDIYPYQTGGSLVKQKIINAIKSAKYTLDICLYNNSDADIVSALKLAKNKGIRVRYITDKGTSNTALKELNFPVLYLGTDGGIMHNKFIIADANKTEAALLFGSCNFTPNGFNDDANNLMVIKDQSLCLAFQIEFEEMWDSNTATPGSNPKSGNKKSDNTPHYFTIDGIPVEAYFSPTDKVESNILRQLSGANYNLRFAIFTFTSDSLAYEIVNKKKEGLSIRGITDNNEDFPGKLIYMQNNGVDVIDHSPASQLHHKYAVIDAEYNDSEPLVVTGSHNWTWSADNINDESTLFIHNSDIAKLYVAEFNSRYCELAPWDCNLLSDFNEPQADIRIFPTLFQDHLHVSTELSSSISGISVFDVYGRPVYYTNWSGSQEENFNLSFLASGNYFISIYGPSGIIKTFKALKL